MKPRRATRLRQPRNFEPQAALSVMMMVVMGVVVVVVMM
jgi:hypothetical protein